MRKIFYLGLLLTIIVLTSCQTNDVETSWSIETIIPTQTSTKTINIQPTATNPVKSTRTKIPSATLNPSPTPERVVTLMAVGDIMLGRTIGDLIISQGNEAPFLYTAETLQTADITVGNLECPISARGTPVDKKYVFRAPAEAGASLAFAGFDLVSLANNHSLDYGPPALEDTIQLLEQNQVLTVGAGHNESEAYQPVVIEIDGLKIAFLAFVDVPTQDYDYLSWEAAADKPGVAWAHEGRVREGVLAAKESADIVVVLVHNGYEFAQKVSGSQQDTAHLAIESGASLVIGSHPHVLQRIEPYLDGLIVYSMGNFVFDNFLFPPNYSAIFSATLTPEGLESYEMIDVVVQLNGVPQIMEYDLDK